MVPFLLRYSGKISTEQSIAQSVVNNYQKSVFSIYVLYFKVLALTLARKFYKTLEAYPINAANITETYGQFLNGKKIDFKKDNRYHLLKKKKQRQS